MFSVLFFFFSSIYVRIVYFRICWWWIYISFAFSFYLLLIVLVSFRFSFLFTYIIHIIYLSLVYSFSWPAIKEKSRKNKGYSFHILLFIRWFFVLFIILIREISNDSLHRELTAAGDKLVMMDFFSIWFEILNSCCSINHLIFRCGSCKNIVPHIDHLCSQYSNGFFLKVDVEKFNKSYVNIYWFSFCINKYFSRQTWSHLLKEKVVRL